MSFGVRSLLAGKKAVNGWYYLLTEDVGKRKHLLVSDKSECEEKGQNIPRVNKDILWMDPFTVSLSPIDLIVIVVHYFQLEYVS